MESDTPASDPPPELPPSPELVALTTVHAQKAVRGDGPSIAWIVKRFTPLLIAQANYRLPRQVRATFDTEDLVNETWAVALSKLERVPLEGQRLTPRLLRFLTSTLLNLANNVARKYARTEARRRRESSTGDTSDLSMERYACEHTDVISAVVRVERKSTVLACLDELDPKDREVILLRGIEQHPNQTAAMLLGIDPKAAATRYHRALKRLREKLPASVFDEI